MKKYVLDYIQKQEFNAGPKARMDINTILAKDSCDGIYMELYHQKNQNIFSNVFHKFKFMLQICIKMSKIQKKSIVIMQYPFYNNRTAFLTIKLMCTVKKCVLISLIHDIENIRYQKGNKCINHELNMLKLSDYLIVHNCVMKDVFEKYDKYFDNIIYELKLFDYITYPANSYIHPEFTKKIIIAGNLMYEKSPYVYKLNGLHIKNISIDLYGSNYHGDSDKTINYKGVFSSENIPFHEGFGLVWDGDSIDTCSGNTGEYTRINNPHKLSLYMAAGIPVIVWKEAAIAKFVQENNVGFCVDSLSEIDNLLGNVTEETYRELVNNVKLISERVRKGYYTLNVLDNIFNDILKKQEHI